MSGATFGELLRTPMQLLPFASRNASGANNRRRSSRPLLVYQCSALLCGLKDSIPGCPALNHFILELLNRAGAEADRLGDFEDTVTSRKAG
jgi:hypothetical protein